MLVILQWQYSGYLDISILCQSAFSLSNWAVDGLWAHHHLYDISFWHPWHEHSSLAKTWSLDSAAWDICRHLRASRLILPVFLLLLFFRSFQLILLFKLFFYFFTDLYFLSTEVKFPVNRRVFSYKKNIVEKHYSSLSSLKHWGILSWIIPYVN